MHLAKWFANLGRGEVGQIFQARGIALANAFSIEEAGDGELEPFGGEGVAVMIRPKLVKSYFR